MNKNQIISEISKLVKLYSENERLYTNLCKYLGIHPEAPVVLQIDKNFMNYVRMVSVSTGISEDVINWFIYDNECGKNSLVCYIDEKKKYKINSVKSFVEFELMPKV